MATAKAWQYTLRGPPSAVLKLETNLPIPKPPGPNSLPKHIREPQEWVRVRVSHAALNPGALIVMQLIPALVRAKPTVPDVELCGIVEDVWSPDEHPRRFRKGDALVALLPTGYGFATGNGSLTSHIVLPAQYAIHKPLNCSSVEASGLLVTGLTALRMARDAGLKEGDLVLVNGASGGVGTMAVQLARNIVGKDGLVIGLCSGKNEALVKELGADEVIDYTAYEALPSELSRRFSSQPFDAILDCIGVQTIYNGCASYLQKNKTYVSVGVKPSAMTFPHFVFALSKLVLNSLWPKARWLGGSGRAWKTVYMMDATVEEKEHLAKLVADGKLRVLIDSVWGFDDVVKAYDALGTGRAKGKMVIKVGEEDE